MMTFLMQSQAAVLMSIVKPIIFALTLVGWGWLATFIDKDAEYYYLKRYLCNLGIIASGIFGFALMLLVPYFFIGLPLGLIVLAAGFMAYAFYRNQEVPEKAKWTFSLDSFRQRMDRRQQEQAIKRAAMTMLKSDDTPRPIPTGEDPRAQAHLNMENILNWAFTRRAEQLDMIIDPKRTRIVGCVDGIKNLLPELEPKQALLMLDYLKEGAGLNVSDRRKKQKGRVRVDGAEHGKHTLELTTLGSSRGLRMSITFDPELIAHRSLKQLGLLESQVEQMEQLLKMPGKVVLIVGPRNQGITTTVYSLLSEHDPYTSAVATMEEDIRFELEGINHNRMPEGMPPKQFNDFLAQLLRGDPNVLMITRLADQRTGQLLAQASEEVRIYIPMRVNNTFEALQKWVAAVGNRKLAAKSLGCVITQRLVRLLCITCRTPYHPDAAALKKLNLPSDRVGELFRASGNVVLKDKASPCPECAGTGYRGRLGCFELMMVDDAAREFIATEKYDQLRLHLRKQKMLWLQEAALAKVVESVSDIKEVTVGLDETANSNLSGEHPAQRSGSHAAGQAAQAGGSGAK